MKMKPTYAIALVYVLVAAVSGRASGYTLTNIEDSFSPEVHGRSRRVAPCGAPTTATAAQAQEAVNLHNFYRRQEGASNMLTMGWSAELAEIAQAWANQCVFKHSDFHDCSGKFMSQNIYGAWGGSTGFPNKNFSDAIETFHNEKNNYNLATDTCNTDKVCGHYYQVSHFRSNKVGCASAQCPTFVVDGEAKTNGIFIVCNYRRLGNVYGKYLFLTGAPCSNCDSEATGDGFKCVKELCEPCTPSIDSDPNCKCGVPRTCQNGGVWSTTTCSCVCPRVAFYGINCEKPCTSIDSDPNCKPCSPSIDSDPNCNCGVPRTCKNGGVFSATTCLCDCPKAFYGVNCENPCSCADTVSNYGCNYYKSKGYCAQSNLAGQMKRDCFTTCGFPCDRPASCKA